MHPRAHSPFAAGRLARGLVVALSALSGSAAGAQSFATPPSLTAAERAKVATRPFAPGEVLLYDVHFGSLRVGAGSMEVREITSVRGRAAYHTVFSAKGSIPLLKVNDTFESWFSTDDLSSLRFYQDQEEGFKERAKRYDIFPDRAAFDDLTDDEGEQKSVSNPLDDGSFLYFIRTVPLTVGQTYTFERYFKPDKNPVTVKVVRRERVTVPAGTFDAVVLQPIIKTSGLFSEGGRAEIWLSDDSRRLMLQMKSQLKVGSLNLYLKSVKAGG